MCGRRLFSFFLVGLGGGSARFPLPRWRSAGVVVRSPVFVRLVGRGPGVASGCGVGCGGLVGGGWGVRLRLESTRGLGLTFLPCYRGWQKDRFLVKSTRAALGSLEIVTTIIDES